MRACVRVSFDKPVLVEKREIRLPYLKIVIGALLCATDSFVSRLKIYAFRHVE